MDEMNRDALLDRLAEDTDSLQEAAELAPVVRRLQAWRAPAPSARETGKLTETLRRLVEKRPRNTLSHRLHMGWLVLRSQPRVVQSELWAASAIVIGLGALVTFGYSLSNAVDVTLPFVLIAPVAAAAGIAFLYGPGVDPALEIELTTPVSPRQVLLARLALVFGFDLVFSLVGSAFLALFRADISFWPLVSGWLAPMTFLSSLAFLLTTLTLDPGVSLVACLGLWVLQNLTRLIPDLRLPFPLPDLTTAAARPWLWLLAGLLCATAFWLGGGEEHWLRKQA